MLTFQPGARKSFRFKRTLFPWLDALMLIGAVAVVYSGVRRPIAEWPALSEREAASDLFVPLLLLSSCLSRAFHRKRVIIDLFYQEVRVEEGGLGPYVIKEFLSVSHIDTRFPGLISFKQGEGARQRILHLREIDFPLTIWNELRNCIEHFYDPITRQGTVIPQSSSTI